MRAEPNGMRERVRRRMTEEDIPVGSDVPEMQALGSPPLRQIALCSTPGCYVVEPHDHGPVNIAERPEDALRRYARRLMSIEEAHAPRRLNGDGFTLVWCRECRQDWPCPTVKVARGDDDEVMAIKESIGA